MDGGYDNCANTFTLSKIDDITSQPRNNFYSTQNIYVLLLLQHGHPYQGYNNTLNFMKETYYNL